MALGSPKRQSVYCLQMPNVGARAMAARAKPARLFKERGFFLAGERSDKAGEVLHGKLLTHARGGEQSEKPETIPIGRV